MSNEIGPHESGRCGTALDASRNGSPSVTFDDSESAIATQGADAAGNDEIAGAGSPTEASPPAVPIIFDSGWTTQGSFQVRVQWLGVPDDGRRRRFFRDILSRTPVPISQD